MLSDTISYRMYNYTLCYVMEKVNYEKKSDVFCWHYTKTKGDI